MVLDASGAVEFLLNTDSGGRLAARLMDDSEAVSVPHLIDLEIAQALRRYVSRGALSVERGSLALDHWRDFDVDRYPHEPFLARIWELRANVSAYDAVYVALAETLSTVLVTGDRRLAGAPGVKARIELV
ncbi:MAG: type II toxin-antitoxin system VapC family toxin [Gammaproteobacteria bacterium]|nr:type II toxin-antitoxin system VapC family toxin [Gammaproteobacteria bacterium]MDE0661358.1 type II toxin-antitoxin system VapC family toxin [Gammaproteobacteria bacterium]